MRNQGATLVALVNIVLVAFSAVPGCDQPSAAPKPVRTPTATAVAAPSATAAPPSTPAPSPTPAQTVLVVSNTAGDGVYIRRTPSDADRIKPWPDGTRMIVLGPDQQAEGKTWKHVKDPAGNEGWIPAQYLAVAPAVAPAASTPGPTATAVRDQSLAGQVRTVVNTNGDGVRLRSACQDNAPGSGLLPEGSQVTVQYGQSDCPGWVLVKAANGQTTWVRTQYLSGGSPPGATANPPTAVVRTPTVASSRFYTGSNTGHHLVKIMDGARYLTLEDGSLWEVDETSREAAASWSESNGINVMLRALPAEAPFPYEITNTSQVSPARASVRARFLGITSKP